MSELAQGLSLSGIGILITFTALGILIGLILLLKVVFPHKEENGLGKEAMGASPQHPPQEREELLKQVAAAGVSVLVKKMSRSTRGSLGKTLEDPVGGWWGKGVDRVQGKE